MKSVGINVLSYVMFQVIGDSSQILSWRYIEMITIILIVVTDLILRK